MKLTKFLRLALGLALMLEVAPGKLEAGAKDIIPAESLQDDAVETAKIKDLNVTTGKLAATAVTKAKAKVFVSTEQTGNGSAQSVAHGLGATPAAVLIAITEFGAAVAVDVAEGTHTATNVVVTVTNAVKYKVFAWA